MTRTFYRLLLLLISTTTLAQPATYSSAQIERVAKLSELYGHIKFFHPYLGYKDINWDSAFAATAPLVASAKTDEETVSAIKQLFRVLDDDITTVTLKTGKPAVPASTDSVQVYFDKDSALVLKMNSYKGVADVEPFIEKVEYLISQLPKARSIQLDLRSPRPLSDYDLDGFKFTTDYLGLPRLLSAEAYATPGMRRRNHSGFATEGGGGQGYWSGFYIKSGQTIQPPKNAKNSPLTILVNKNAALSPALFALKARPHVTFRSDDTLTDAQLVSTVSFPFNDQIQVQFRTGELVNADGSLGTKGVAALLPVTPARKLYPATRYPSLGYRLLAGAKIWSVIHYFHAYKTLIPHDWNTSLRTAIGELASASDSAQYVLAVAHFYRNIQDGHGFISSLAYEQYIGNGYTPVTVRFIDSKPVITNIWADSIKASGVREGDVVVAINGENVSARIQRLSAIIAASNEWTRQDYIARRLLNAPIGTRLQVKLLGSDGREKTLTLKGLPYRQAQPPTDTSAHFRLLPGNIGYAHMGRLQVKDVSPMFDAFKKTKAIIFDMRNYPNGTAWTIAPYLTNRPNVIGAQFFRYAPAEADVVTGESGATSQKYFFDQQIPPNTGQSVYKGKTVMLIDERTQSQAEHSGLFFEAANGTEFIGSPTAGANGDVTSFFVPGGPGGISLTFSGHDVRHADGRQLQQVGLQPKILVRPTINGIRTGKDEVLERAVQYLNTGK